MKILVLGGGVIGVTTAYYLAEAGHEVTVVDRQKGPALETSFANAGEVSPGYASPWAGPGIPLKAIKWLLMKHGPLVVRPAFDPHMWTWLIKMLRNCTAERYAINKARMVPLAEYSRDTLKALREATGIAYDERAQGTLQLFRTQKQLDGTGGDVEVLKKYGVPYEVLDPGRLHRGGAGAGRRARKVRRRPAGCRGDETGDCKMFTDRLAELCVARGVTFEYGTTIRRVIRNRNRITSISTEQGLDGRRRLCDGDGQLFGDVHAPAEAADPGLSGQGLFDHRADQGCRRGTGVDGDGRDLQGGDHPARRPHPGRRHGGDFRLRPQAARIAAPHARTFGRRSVSGRRRHAGRRPSGAGCGR